MGVRGNKNKKIRKINQKPVKCHKMNHLQVNKSQNKQLQKLLTDSVYYAQNTPETIFYGSWK